MHGLILIIFGKQHQHTFINDMHVQLSLYFHFYLFYLILNSCDGNDALSPSVLVKQSSSKSRKHRIFVSSDLCPPNSSIDYRICGLVQEHVDIVQNTCLRHQRLEAAPHWHMGKHNRHRWSSCSTEKAVTCKHEGKRTSLWTSAKLKPAVFRANTLHNRQHQQSTEENTLFRVISIAAI